jgi:hypothetical protein
MTKKMTLPPFGVYCFDLGPLGPDGDFTEFLGPNLYQSLPIAKTIFSAKHKAKMDRDRNSQSLIFHFCQICPFTPIFSDFYDLPENLLHFFIPFRTIFCV